MDKNSQKKFCFARVLTDFVLFAFFLETHSPCPAYPLCECKVCVVGSASAVVATFENADMHVRTLLCI